MKKDTIINEKCIGTDLQYINRESSEELYNKLDSNGKLCALGFLIKFLEGNENEMKDTYIMCPSDNGDVRIYYSEAVLVFEELVSRIVDPAKCRSIV